MLSLVIPAATVIGIVSALNNGVGKLPKMGYDSTSPFSSARWAIQRTHCICCTAFNAFGCDYDQTKVLAQVDAMVSYGLVEVGYNVSIWAQLSIQKILTCLKSMILDDCFTLLVLLAKTYKRSPSETLTGNLVITIRSSSLVSLMVNWASLYCW